MLVWIPTWSWMWLMLRSSELRASPFPLRTVVEVDQTTAWWDLVCEWRDYFVKAECGHWLRRRRRAGSPPKRVRCEACMPREPDGN